MNQHQPSSSPRAPRRPRRVGVRRFRVGDRDVISEGLTRLVLQDLFHFFMTVSWPVTFATIAGFFLVFDTFFGWLYNRVPGCIANLNPPGFWGAFFFSVETLATVGYGDMHPQTPYGHVIAMLEIFVGVIMLALITGLMFARFSRPRARFLFSRHAVIRPIEGQKTLLFRTANARQNVVQDASAKLRLLRDVATSEGYKFRKISDLSLVRAQHPAFTLGWTIMHVIDESSPLNGETPESLHAAAASFILSLTGTDETTGQTLTSRANYSSRAIMWNHSFTDILEVREDGTVHIDYAKFDDIEPLSESAPA
jgi:inward rectifier potassium channel